MKLAICGYRCDLCKAFVENIAKNDERAKLLKMWKQYYGTSLGLGTGL